MDSYSETVTSCDVDCGVFWGVGELWGLYVFETSTGAGEAGRRDVLHGKVSGVGTSAMMTDKESN